MKDYWWAGEDSNLRRLSRQIYSLLPLTAREPAPFQRGTRNAERGTKGTPTGSHDLAVRSAFFVAFPVPHSPFRIPHWMEPAGRLELPTPGLQNRCSAVELRRPSAPHYTILYRPFNPSAPNFHRPRRSPERANGRRLGDCVFLTAKCAKHAKNGGNGGTTDNPRRLVRSVVTRLAPSSARRPVGLAGRRGGPRPAASPPVRARSRFADESAEPGVLGGLCVESTALVVFVLLCQLRAPRTKR